jgi:regulator of telomere elongation helicase 1
MKKENEKEKKEYPLIGINLVKSKTQKLINIEGISIYFPFEPYPSQIAYMKNVILTLNKEESLSALESPTGTGKTLCLLCAVLAWIKHNNKQISIYYCTRTVSQINNVLKELKKTCYSLQYSFLASRVYTCLKFEKEKRIKMDSQKLNDICQKFRDNIKKIKKEKKKKKGEEEGSFDSEENMPNKSKFKFNKLNNKCNKMKGKKNQELEICEYYIEEDNFDVCNYNNIEDIEDLLKEGERKKFCPYFYNLSKTKNYANLTFMTYNYILGPKIRKRINIFEKNSIVILDEAHNICNILENLFSKKLNIKELEKIQQLLQIILDFINENRRPYYTEDELPNINPLLFLDTKEINDEINIIKKIFISNKKFRL